MSRKYRHQGYQDSDRNDRRESRSRRPSPNGHSTLTKEELIHKRSLRHAIAREANEVIRCHNCGRNVATLDAISPAKTCPYCNVSLHCCRACLHFDSAARWQCRAEISRPVGDKSSGNDCTFYAPRLVLDTTGRRSDSPRTGGGPKEDFDNLFKR